MRTWFYLFLSRMSLIIWPFFLGAFVLDVQVQGDCHIARQRHGFGRFGCRSFGPQGCMSLSLTSQRPLMCVRPLVCACSKCTHIHVPAKYTLSVTQRRMTCRWRSSARTARTRSIWCGPLRSILMQSRPSSAKKAGTWCCQRLSLISVTLLTK